jgi:hypothetical protein
VAAAGGLLAQVGQQRGALDRVDREQERHGIGLADHARPGAHRAHPGADAQRVEPGGFGMAPGVVGIHPAREHGQLGVQAREVLQVGPVHPGREVADTYAFARAPGVGQVQRGVAGLERQAQLGRQLGVGELPFGGQLTAELHGAPVRQPFLLQPATRALARFQHDHVHAGAGQIARRPQTGQPGPRHHDVVS